MNELRDSQKRVELLEHRLRTKDTDWRERMRNCLEAF